MSCCPSIAVGTPLDFVIVDHLFKNRLAIQVRDRLLISVRRGYKCRISGFASFATSVLVLVGSSSIAIAIASAIAIARVPVASVISLKSLVSKISSGAMGIAMRALISSISMRWS